jgi:hypothetical protein
MCTTKKGQQLMVLLEKIKWLFSAILQHPNILAGNEAAFPIHNTLW